MARIKTKAGTVEPAAEPVSSRVSATDSVLWDDYQASWIAVFAGLSVLLIVLVWGPLSRIGVHYSIGYNEGNAAYFSRQAVTGPPLYTVPPKFVYIDYPPLSYHLVGLAGKLAGNYVAAGRWISLFAYLAIGVLAGLVVRVLSGYARAGVYTALCWGIWLAAFDPTRIGFNDPHLLAVVFGMTGLYCYVRGPESTRWLAASAVLFAVSLFTKQSLIAFPGAVAIELFLTSRKRLGMWLGIAIGTCVILLLLTFVVDGPHFFSYLFSPRTFAFGDFLNMFMLYTGMFQVVIAAALIWILRYSGAGRDRVLVWAAVLANVLGSVFVLGVGAGINHFIDAMLSILLILGSSVVMLAGFAEQTRWPRTTLAVLLGVVFFFGPIVNVPRRILEAESNQSQRTEREQSFAAVVKFLKAQPGQALCEDPMFCFEAGKPKVYDAFNAGEVFKTGTLPESAVLDLLDRRAFGAIQLNWSPTDPIRPSKPRYSRFTDTFVRKLFATYRPSIQTPSALIFTPAR
jgi:hypothetical protein